MKRDKLQIGLLGRDCDTGLGYQNAAIAQFLGVSKWLVPFRYWQRHKRSITAPRGRIRVSRRDGHRRIKKLLAGLDWILFAEQPEIPRVVRIARDRGVAVACVPNWEFLDPRSEWIRWVDLMICPTRITYHMISDWKDRYRLDFAATHIPWPIDLQRHPFRQRDRFQSVLYINGWGGGRARRLDGTQTHYRRKRLDIVIAAAALVPEINFLISSQTKIGSRVPRNVQLLPRQADNRSLYDLGDVCLQPSSWEGIGLPLLECQAAGLPLVTTDAAPMNEYNPMTTFPAIGRELVRLSTQPFLANHVDPSNVAEVLRELRGTSIAAASGAAREFVATEHCWSTRGPQIRSALEAFRNGTRMAENDHHAGDK